MSKWMDQIDHYRLQLEDLETRVQAGEIDALKLLEETRAELAKLASGLQHAELQRDVNIERLGELVEISARILACKTPQAALDAATQASLDLTGAQSSLAFYRTPDNQTIDACAGEAVNNLVGEYFRVQDGGIYQEILAHPGALRLNIAQMRKSPGGLGLLEEHFPVNDLLGASLKDEDGESFGMLLVTGKQPDEFSIEGEYLLAQIASLTSLALQNMQAGLQEHARAAELDAIFLSASDALILYDRQGAVVRANPAARRLFGGVFPSMKSDGTNGQPELFAPDGHPIDPSDLPLQAALQSGKPTGWLYFHCHLPDGRQIELNASGSPLMDDSGQSYGAVTVWHDVTDLEQARRRAEQEANRAGLLAEELNSIFAAMTDSVTVFDLQGKPVRMNPAAREQYNFNVIQTPLEETMTRINLRRMDGAPLSVEDLPSRRALHGEIVVNELSIQVDPEGKDQIILSSAAPIFDSSGRITGSVVVWHDITEAEQVHMQYRHQRELLERIIEQAPIGIALLEGPDHRYTLSNRAMNSISRGKGNLIGRTAAEVWPEVAHQFIPVFDHVYKTGERYQIENLLMRVERDRGPEEAYFSYTCTPITGLNGQADSVLFLVLETTAEVRNRRQLEQEQAFLKTVIESAPMAIVIADARAQVVATNPAADRIYHRPVPFGKDYSTHAELNVCYPDGRLYDPRDLPLTRSALDGETYHDLEMAILWPGEEKRSLIVNTAPIINSAGERIGAVGVFDDVTDYRRSISHDRFLAELGQDLLLQTRPQSIFELVSRRLREHLQADRVIITEVNRTHGSRMKFCESHRENLAPVSDPSQFAILPHGIVSDMWQGHFFWTGDVLEDDRLSEISEKLAQNDFRALLLLPRVTNKQEALFLNVISAAPRDWQEDELALAGSVADLTWLELERARLLEDLQSSEHRYRRLFESNIIGVTYSYLDGKVVEANDAFLAITGYSRRDLETGKIDWRNLTPPEYLPLDSQAVAESMERGFCAPFEKEYLRKDGTRIPVMIGLSPLDETAAQYVCFVLDMSEQKRYRDALRETQKRLELALTNTRITMFTQNLDFRYTWIYNPHPDLKSQAVIGRTDAELLNSAEMSEADLLKKELIATGKRQRKDVRFEVHGETFIYDLTVDPQFNDRGEIVGIMGVAIDVTERYQLEGEMRNKAALVEMQRTILQHREKERMEIARDLHDGLLQELVGISFGLGAIPGYDDREKSLERLNQIRAALGVQIQDLRNFCTDLRPPALAPFGVEKALRSFIVSFQERNPDLQVHLDLMRDGKTLNEMVRLVIFRISQELLSNVARHAHAGQVWVRFQINPERVSLEVRDDGQGFQPPDRWIYLAREGHFGLVGIQERVEAVNGRMEVESAPGKGTRIAVSIPLKHNPAIEGSFEI